MSTRCVINFNYGKRIEAKVYRHSDGYPAGESGVLADLQRFFAEVERQTNDNRYGDPSYLAAKFVVWQAEEYATDWEGNKKQPLDFLGVGVCTRNPGDIEYIYTVKCKEGGLRPEVTCRKARGG